MYGWGYSKKQVWFVDYQDPNFDYYENTSYGIFRLCRPNPQWKPSNKNDLWDKASILARRVMSKGRYLIEDRHAMTVIRQKMVYDTGRKKD